MSVPQELGAAYLEITTKGLDKAKADLGVLKSNLFDSTKGQDKLNSKLAESGRVADDAHTHFRALLESVAKLTGAKIDFGIKDRDMGKDALVPVRIIAEKVIVEIAPIPPVKIPAEPIKPVIDPPAPIKVQAVPVKVDSPQAEAPSALKSALGMAGKLKEGVSSALGTVSATPIFQTIKTGTSAAITGFGKVKAAISGALDRATDIPVLRQLKTGIAYVNTSFDDFLKNRYGKLATPIKMSGMALDMGLMTQGIAIPGMSIAGTLPAMAGAEAYKQGKDYLGRRQARKEKGEAPTLLDKGVNVAVGAVGTLASKVKSIPLAPLVTGLKAVGRAGLAGFGAAAVGVGNFLGRLNGEILTKFAEKVKEVGAAVTNSINQVGSAATRGFAILAGGIGATVRMADPVGFHYFTAAIQGVSIQIGRIFVPLLRDLTRYLIQIEQVLRSLTDAQRAQILHWAKVALVVLGSVMAFTQLFGILSTGFTILSSFVAVLTALGLSTPVGWVIALAAALAALIAVVAIGSGGMNGLFAGIRPALTALVQAFQTCFAAIRPIIADGMNFLNLAIGTGLRTVIPIIVQFAALFASTVGRIVGVLQPIISTLMAQALAVFTRIQPVLSALLTGVMGVFGAVFGVVTRLYAAVAPIIGGIIQMVIPLFEKFYTAFYGIVGRLLPIVSRLISAIGSFLVPVITMVWGTIKTVIGAIMPLVSAWIDVLSTVWGAVVDIFSSLMDAIEPLFSIFGEGAGIFETLLAVVINWVLAPLRGLAMILQFLVPIIAWFASGLVGLVQTIVGVVRPAFQFFADMIRDINIGFRRVINGLIDFVNGMMQRLPRPIRPAAIERIGSGMAPGPQLPAAPASPANQNQNFRGEARQTSQLSGIAEAWRKAQQATTTDPNTALLQQQVGQGDTTNGYLQQILAQLSGNGGPAPAPAAFGN